MTDDTIQHSDPNSSPTQTASTTRIADDTRQHSDPSPSSTQVASIPKTTTTDDTIQQPDPSPLSPPPTSTDNIAPPSESIPSPTTQPMERPPAQPSLDTQFVAEPSVQHLFNDSRLNTIPKQEHYRSSSTWTHLPYEPTFVYYTNYYYPPPQYTTANFNSPPNGI
ncbi:hypothetical protein BC941DRAFT_424044 [Chlamydoabsidia padenii]|nr:hypothetical protein BC941DRAFT_424044 [Chlamydoabsidia padenii]